MSHKSVRKLLTSKIPARITKKNLFDESRKNYVLIYAKSRENSTIHEYRTCFLLFTNQGMGDSCESQGITFYIIESKTIKIANHGSQKKKRSHTSAISISNYFTYF